jgi:hypothetical protein
MSVQRLEIAAPVTIGKTPARVVRHLDDRFAVESLRAPATFSKRTSSRRGGAVHENRHGQRSALYSITIDRRILITTIY